MIVTILLLLILLAAFSLVWWGVNRMAVPEPIKTIVLVILGLLALLFIYNMVAGGGLHLTMR
jgi:hypothetical protein